MIKFGFIDRFRIPSYDNPDHMRFGEVEFDYYRCTGCSTCVRACPAKALTMEGTVPKMLAAQAKENQCAFCGDCVAICPTGSIRMKAPYRFTRYFKQMDEGPATPPRL